VTTEAVGTTGTVVVDERPALESTLMELESRPSVHFRSVAAPAAAVERRAAELGEEDLVMRARLLQATSLVREGRSEQGGQRAHQVQAWAQQHDHPFLLARAHRLLSMFYGQIGDVSEGLTHAVQCVANLADDEPQNIRARHLMALAVALDESGSTVEGDRRFREALAIATEIGDHDVTMNILNNMAYTAYERNDEPGARDLVRHMYEVRDRSGYEFGAIELDTIARIEMMSGNYDAAEETLRLVLHGGESVLLSHEGDAPAVCMLTLAEARRLSRRYAAAQEALDAAMKLADERGLDRVRAQLREEQAALFAATGRYQEAYDEHRAFYAAAAALYSVQREAQARALQAVFEATEARRASEHFREMAHRDALTGLYNRRYVNERLPALLSEAIAQRTPLSLAILDLDHFKRINDTLSHSTGDTVLQEVSRLLSESVSGPMILARIGGEEFLLLLPGMGAQEAADCCERLRLRIRAHAWEPVTGTLPVTTSIGVTTTAEGRASSSTLLSLADRNLYTAKREGRDRVVADL
jgi:diguanylate cyclase (GGDEF)-like protein